MTNRLLDGMLLTLAICMAGLAVQRAKRSGPVFAMVPVPPQTKQPGAAPGPRVLAVAAAELVQENPFRLNRAPALIRIGQPLPTNFDVTAPSVSRLWPVLVVRAIVGGPPWSALVEGFPGLVGTTVVREGTQHGDLTVGMISRDTVVVTAKDTVWKLTVKPEVQ